MDNLNHLINEYGNPDILIDSNADSSKKYAIWGFDEIFEINNQGAFLNGKAMQGDCLDVMQNIFDKWKINNNNSNMACAGFISYEFKKFIYKHIDFNDNKISDFPYAWFCKPKIVREYESFTLENNINGVLDIIDDIIDIKEYKIKISKIKEFLKNGDVYQINFTDFKKIHSNFTDPFNLYQVLRNIAKPAHGFFLHTNSFDILSLSPELFLQVINGEIYTSPIKGTRPSAFNHHEDIVLKKDLQNSIKDKAEHLMIVDLLRNDLGKICDIGSIKVYNLYRIQSFKTIHHMVTDIKGQLSKNITETDIIKAMFPGGSITGAPKESAMSIIDTLEPQSRNIYTGNAGYILNNGDMSFNICIRTLLKTNNFYEYGIGGGIVWDSNAEDEWHEAQHKSKILEPLL